MLFQLVKRNRLQIPLNVSLTTKRLINLDQILGRYFLEQIHFGYRIAGRRRIGSGSLGLMLGIGTTGHRTGYQ